MHEKPIQRLISGTAANLIGKVGVLLLQVMAVPVFISGWGVDGYGLWLMITAIPTYLALSDIGLATAARSDLTRSISSSNTEEALRTLQSIWLLLTILSAALGLLVIVGTISFLAYNNSHEEIWTHREMSWAVFFVVGAAILNIQMNVMKVVFESSKLYSFGTILFDLSFIVTSLSAIIAAYYGGGIISAAAAQFTCRLLATALYAMLMKRSVPWVMFGIQHFQLHEIRRLLKPSLAAMALQGANSLGLQGVVLTIGFVFGPSYVALFSATRMLTRIPLQISGLVARASLPELTRAKTLRDSVLFKKIIRINILTAFLVMATALIVLTITGPLVVSKLSGGALEGQRWMFFMLSLSAAFAAIWGAVGTSLLATNKHAKFSYVALIAYGLTAASPYLSFGSMNIVLTSLVVADIFIAAATYRAVVKNV